MYIQMYCVNLSLAIINKSIRVWQVPFMIFLVYKKRVTTTRSFCVVPRGGNALSRGTAPRRGAQLNYQLFHSMYFH